MKYAGREQKVYVALFTCTRIRAVHLELVSDNSTDSFLQAFRRFISRRSKPSLIVAASKVLKKLYDDPKVKNSTLNNRIGWHFVTLRSPWEGGFYERMIALVKVSLKKCLGKAFVTHEEMSTLIAEVEAVINDRPLAYIGEDIRDNDPVTPSQLLLGYRVTGLPAIEKRHLKDLEEIPSASTYLLKVLSSLRGLVLLFQRQSLSLAGNHSLLQ